MEKADRLSIHLYNLQKDIKTGQKLLDTYLELSDLYQTTEDLKTTFEVIAEAQAHVNSSILSVINELANATIRAPTTNN